MELRTCRIRSVSPRRRQGKRKKSPRKKLVESGTRAKAEKVEKKKEKKNTVGEDKAAEKYNVVEKKKSRNRASSPRKNLEHEKSQI